MCSFIAENLPWIKVVLSNDIAAILPCTVLYVQPKCSHTLYVQYTRVSSWLFSTILFCQQEYFTWKRGYSVHTVCSCIAQNVRWSTVVLSNDITAILPCTAHYLQPECSRTLHFQYTRVSKSFFNTTLYCKQAYLTWEKWVQCAYVVSYIAKNARWITGVLSYDIAAILPWTSLYVQP